MATTAILLGAAALGTGASIYGASQTPEGVRQHDLAALGYNPQSDPLLSALSLNALSGIGSFDPNVYRQASPVQQLLNQISTSGNLRRRQFDQLRSALSIKSEDFNAIAGMSTPDAKMYLQEHGYSPQQSRNVMRGLARFGGIVQSSGYGSIGELLQANEEYLGRIPALQAQYQPVADAMRQGLLASQQRTAGYLQDLPNLLTGQANPFTRQLREEALTTSQKYGVNPYNLLEQADAVALQRALSLIGGEQAVVGAQQAGALPVAQLRQQGGASAANLGAAQAQMLAQALQSQQAGQAAQANAWMGAGNQLAALGLIGADIYQSRQPAVGNGQPAGNDAGSGLLPYFTGLA